jgi:hypothetical protein
MGLGGESGGPDPSAAHTGENVYGYNLWGDYYNSIPETHLTTPPIDCSGLYGLRLRYWRWLGVESPDHDHASVRISTDGVYWPEVWSNDEECADTSWVLQEIDLGDIVNDQPTVYLRWTMGTTDFLRMYCGWNIDDIQLLAFSSNAAVGAAASDRMVMDASQEPVLRLDPITPNPFNPTTRISFTLPTAGHVRLAVYDARGSLVIQLVDGHRDAGHLVTAWQGRDAAGRQVSSGVYFVRLQAEHFEATRRAVLVR